MMILNSNCCDKKPCHSEMAAVQSSAPEKTQEPLTKVIIPESIQDSDQKLAYQEFINVLSAILMKYAAELKNNDT